MATTAVYTTVLALSTTLFVCFIAALYRLTQILPPRTRSPPSKAARDAHILLVLGSGGHTAELLSMLHRAYPNHLPFSQRTYVVSSGDALSAQRAKELEDSQQGKGDWKVCEVPRARKIHQPLYTAPVSCLFCLRVCMTLLYQDPPDLILCNGPATATVLVFASLFLRFLGLGGGEGKMRTVYIESWARVKRLSLSGRILARVVDRLCVQWESLDGCCGGRGEFIGCLI